MVNNQKMINNFTMSSNLLIESSFTDKLTDEAIVLAGPSEDSLQHPSDLVDAAAWEVSII